MRLSMGGNECHGSINAQVAALPTLPKGGIGSAYTFNLSEYTGKSRQL